MDQTIFLTIFIIKNSTKAPWTQLHSKNQMAERLGETECFMRWGNGWVQSQHVEGTKHSVLPSLQIPIISDITKIMIGILLYNFT
jgi:hypothetical protein